MSAPPPYESNPDTRPLPEGWISQYDPKWVPDLIDPFRSDMIDAPATKLGQLSAFLQSQNFSDNDSGTMLIQRPHLQSQHGSTRMVLRLPTPNPNTHLPRLRHQ